MWKMWFLFRCTHATSVIHKISECHVSQAIWTFLKFSMRRWKRLSNKMHITHAILGHFSLKNRCYRFGTQSGHFGVFYSDSIELKMPKSFNLVSALHYSRWIVKPHKKMRYESVIECMVHNDSETHESERKNTTCEFIHELLSI